MFTSTFAVGPRRWALDPGALRPLIVSYVADLASRGYEAATIHHMEHCARHFCYWLNHSGFAISQTNDDVIDRFAKHQCRCPGERASGTLSAAFVGMVRKFVRFLEESQVVHRAERPSGDGRIQSYFDWLREHRGLSELTIEARRKLMKQILPLLGSDPGSYDAASVRGVILSESQRRSAVNMKSIVTVLRSYLGYLATQGQCSPSLVQAVPNGGPLEAFEYSQVFARRQSGGFDQLVRYGAERHSRSCHLAAAGASWSTSGRHHEAVHQRHRLAAGQPARLRQGAQGSETPFAAGRR